MIDFNNDMNDIKPLISVIIPIYNSEEYLEKCIDSILCQEYSNIELILINDGSTDNSGLICDKYSERDDRVKVFHKNNAGVSSARNYGLRNCTGDWIVFIDSDDEIKLDYFSSWYHLSLIFNSDVFFFTEKTFSKICIVQFNQKEILSQLVESKIMPSLCLGIYKKVLFENDDMLLNETIHYYEDFEFLYRIFKRTESVTLSNQNFYKYNKREGSANRSNINEKILSCLKIPDEISRYDPYLSSYFIDKLRFRFIQQTVYYLLKSEKPDAKIVKYMQTVLRNNIKLLFSYRLKCNFFTRIILISSLFSVRYTYIILSKMYRNFLFKKGVL